MKVWRTAIHNMECRLADIGMFIDTDILRPGREIEERQAEDIPLQLVHPELTQRSFQGEKLTMLQSAPRQKWTWVSQFIDEHGKLKQQPEAMNGRPVGAKRRRTWKRWVATYHKGADCVATVVCVHRLISAKPMKVRRSWW